MTTQQSDKSMRASSSVDMGEMDERNEHSDLMNETEFTDFADKELNASEHEQADRLPVAVIAQQLVTAFNHSPYMQLNGMQMRAEGDSIRCYLDTSEDLIGNVNFKILHGGVAATMLDSIGGVVAMLEIYRANQGSTQEQFKKISRLATVDLRVDYLAPGRGKQFIGSAEVMRMGRKGCTMRMQMINDEDKLIAVGVASFAY